MSLRLKNKCSFENHYARAGTDGTAVKTTNPKVCVSRKTAPLTSARQIIAFMLYGTSVRFTVTVTTTTERH